MQRAVIKGIVRSHVS